MVYITIITLTSITYIYIFFPWLVSQQRRVNTIICCMISYASKFEWYLPICLLHHAITWHLEEFWPHNNTFFLNANKVGNGTKVPRNNIKLREENMVHFEIEQKGRWKNYKHLKRRNSRKEEIQVWRDKFIFHLSTCLSSTFLIKHRVHKTLCLCYFLILLSNVILEQPLISNNKAACTVTST